MIVRCVSSLTERLVAATPPTLAEVTAARLVPVTTTDVPPVGGPTDGEIDVMVGAAPSTVKTSLGFDPPTEEPPPGVSTWIRYAPAGRPNCGTWICTDVGLTDVGKA